jgi:hypothetical protein
LDIENFDDYWLWVRTVLYEKIFSRTDFAGRPLVEEHGPNNEWRIGLYNRLIGPIRFRQVRTKEGSCDFPETHVFSRPCWGPFSAAAADSRSLEPAAGMEAASGTVYATGLSDFSGHDDDGGYYGGMGHVVDLPLDDGETLKRITGMQMERWTDEATRAIAIDINTYNANTDISTVTRLSIDVVPGGRIYPTVSQSSCRLSPYNMPGDQIRLGVECVFLGLLFYYICVEIQELYTLRWKYFDFWNAVECANLGLYVVIVSGWVELMLRDRSVFMKRDYTTFHDLYAITGQFERSTRYCAFNIVWSFIRFFKYMQLNPRFAILWEVMVNAFSMLAPFSLIMILMMLSFAYSGYWLFGSELKDFHTFTSAFTYMLLCMTEGYDYQEMKDIAPTAAPMWCLGWTVSATLVLSNLFIAIISDSFTFVICRTAKLDEIARPYEHLIPTPWIFLRAKVFWFIPSFDEDLQLKINDIRAGTRSLRNLFGEVNDEAFWEIVLRNAAEGCFALEPQDIVGLFKKPNDPDDDPTILQEATEWLSRLAVHGSIPYMRTDDEPTAKSELSKLMLMVNIMERELNDLGDKGLGIKDFDPYEVLM